MNVTSANTQIQIIELIRPYMYEVASGFRAWRTEKSDKEGYFIFGCSSEREGWQYAFHIAKELWERADYADTIDKPMEEPYDEFDAFFTDFEESSRDYLERKKDGEIPTLDPSEDRRNMKVLAQETQLSFVTLAVFITSKVGKPYSMWWCPGRKDMSILGLEKEGDWHYAFEISQNNAMYLYDFPKINNPKTNPENPDMYEVFLDELLMELKRERKNG